MRILLSHSDFIEYEPKSKALESAKKAVKEKKRIEECLVVFTAIEKNDGTAEVFQACDEIDKVAGNVKTNRIVIYPWVHLTNTPASPTLAMDLLAEFEKKLADKFEVYSSPFGWYKSFTISRKGHPLSELSREIRLEKKQVNEEKYDYKELLRQISKTKIDTRVLKDNDHRILGQKLDLFSFSETAPGMVFWHNNGWIVYNELINFWRDEHRKLGYQEISTPQILDKKLWQISGHWEKYKENIFLTSYENREMAVKPMNCPSGILVYKSRPRSYRELPMRVAELGIVHRQELSGVLNGLFRITKFTQDDAHIYCTKDQLEDEIIAIMSLIDKIYKKFSLDYHIELSTRPEKRIGDEKLWDIAEKILKNVLNKHKIKFRVNPGDGAFYGPKIDFHIKDSLDRTWQCATIQLDFAMPERFDLEYMDSDNTQKRPVMIHRTIYGAIERFIGMLIEHLNGNFPVWLSPVQTRVLSLTDRNIKAVEILTEKLKNNGIRADSDTSPSTVNEKIRNAELMKISYIILIGDKEETNKTLAVRMHGEKPKFNVDPDKFIEGLKEEIRERR